MEASLLGINFWQRVLLAGALGELCAHIKTLRAAFVTLRVPARTIQDIRQKSSSAAAFIKFD